MQGHWSRHQSQRQKDSSLLGLFGLAFGPVSGHFSRLSRFHKKSLPEIKYELIDRLAEAHFQGENSPEHQETQRIWDKHFEELKSV